MKTTVLKRNGKRIPSSEAHQLARNIGQTMLSVGFYTEPTVTEDGCLKLTVGRMACFQVIPERLGYNAKVGRYVTSPKGYKRTRTPLWEQRVRFNHLLNDCLDAAGITCAIKSGGVFTVRTIQSGRVDSWDNPAEYGLNCAELMPEAEAIARIERKESGAV
jgi:hypothetical protein